MAYAKGIRWTDELIMSEIRGMVEALKLETFPSHSEMIEYFGNYALAVKVTKSGGTRHWANVLGLPIKSCESEMGNDFELCCMGTLIEQGFDCEQMRPRYPYDLTANRNIKVDVKSGFVVNNSNGKYYTFNLEKSNPTCDIFVMYCLNKNQSIFKTIVIPSAVVCGKTQLSLGLTSEKYDQYVDGWEIFKTYDKFYKSILGEQNE